jgi:hypothetical protein
VLAAWLRRPLAVPQGAPVAKKKLTPKPKMTMKMDDMMDARAAIKEDSARDRKLDKKRNVK